MTFPALSLPDKIIADLGIEDPADIDVEAIAMACGATVVYERLEGSDARIIGNGDRAIITVREADPVERRRFSAAHELGHWMRDRGRVSVSCEASGYLKGWDDSNPEVRANRFAAELLLPKAMFQTQALNRRVTWDRACSRTEIQHEPYRHGHSIGRNWQLSCDARLHLAAQKALVRPPPKARI